MEIHMKVWVVVANSCSDCNEMGLAVFNHNPSTDEKNKVSYFIGGMTCIHTHTAVIANNGIPLSCKLDAGE
jgi:hypothetical protein